MATTLAAGTVPRAYYRRTRQTMPGVYYMRPARGKPAAMVAKMEARGHPLACYWRSILKRHPDAVLLKQYHRGRCSVTGERWTVTRKVLVPPDLKLRQVKRPPGFSI